VYISRLLLGLSALTAEAAEIICCEFGRARPDSSRDVQLLNSVDSGAIHVPWGAGTVSMQYCGGTLGYLLRGSSK
jgi:hypothetical protein